MLKYKLARDLTHVRQQLLWQKQATVIGSIDPDSCIDKYHHTSLAEFRHAVCLCRSVRRRGFAPKSLFFDAARVWSVIL